MKRPFSLKKIIEILVICILGILLSVAFKPNYTKLHELKTQHLLLRQKLTLEEKRNENLKKELHGLKNDPYWIEKVAREKLGWCSSKETVYKFQTRKSY